MKSSVQRSLRANLLSQWNINTETLEEIWPKKESITLVKWSVISPRHATLSEPRYSDFFLLDSRDHISIYALHGEPLFLQHFDGPLIPTLRLLHKCSLFVTLLWCTVLISLMQTRSFSRK